MALLADELGQASPPLLAGVSRRASHGRKDLYQLDMSRIMEQPFGEVLVQTLMGDFLQINPIGSHTLLEAFLKESRVPGVPRKTTDEDEDGYNVFRKVCENVVLFHGTHRFLDKDLPRLFEIMRTEGGAPVPPELRERIRERLVAGESDPRLSPTFEQEGIRGFFAYGARAAIQWEQVARLQQLHVLTTAAACPGPQALMNDTDGKPDAAAHGFHKPAPGRQGQLVYYFQAVDRFKHQQARERYVAALKFVNLSKSANLQGMFGGYIGMRVRLLKKTLPPELVQEATGEIVGIAFHPEEQFGGGHGSSNLRPPDGHECWQRGWVVCDYLPQCVEVRFDGCSEDYTRTGRPGVWCVEPVCDEWKLPVVALFTVGHPNAARAKCVRSTSKKQKTVDVSRCHWGPSCRSRFSTYRVKRCAAPRASPKASS